jgi:hypothetical protein
MMHSKPVTASIGGFILSLSIGGAAAAEPLGEIASIQGAALISHGAGYVPAREGMAVRQLDRVVIMEDSSATLAFKDGCRYDMGELELLTLTSESACRAAEASSATSGETDLVARAAGSEMSGQAQVLQQAASGQLGATAGVGVAGASSGVLILGGLAAAGLIYGLTDDDPDRNRSTEPDRDDRLDLSPQ